MPAIQIEVNHRDEGPHRLQAVTRSLRAPGKRLSSETESEILCGMRYSAQIRAARALLGWSQTQLARRAGLGLATLQRIERAELGNGLEQLRRGGGAGFLNGLVGHPDDVGAGRPHVERRRQ